MFWFTFVVQAVLVGVFIKIMHLMTKLHIEFPCFMFLHGYFIIYVFACQFSVITLEALKLMDCYPVGDGDEEQKSSKV